MSKVPLSGKNSKKGKPPRGRRQNYRAAYPFEFRLRAVKLYIEEEYPAELITAEMGCSAHSLYEWARKYREDGPQGLKPKPRKKGGKKLPAPVRETIIELKQQNPGFGVRRISQFLRRVFFLPGSHETVRKALNEESMIKPVRKKPRRNPPKPRFFERATPNQMWQTDIFTFRLAGSNGYLLGFMDDYSRYIVGLGLYRSQTAENLLEVYRTAGGEYGVPKEMLTDNGRQYTNWRGTTRFERELKKDSIKHIKSSPHHPMTLGKIERFWKSIWTEFLDRARFDTFEEARERLSLWLRYYNHRRPHQGIGGVCPADRFFEVQHDLRKVIDRGIEENVLELALRGKPRKPFYMVGRMEGQSVVMEARKGKLVMSVNDEAERKNSELVYDLRKGDADNGNSKENETSVEETVQRHGEMPGSPGPVVGAPHERGPVPGNVGILDSAEHLAGTSAGSNGDGPRTEESEWRAGSPAGFEAPEVTGEEGHLEHAHRRAVPTSWQAPDRYPERATEILVDPLWNERGPIAQPVPAGYVGPIPAAPEPWNVNPHRRGTEYGEEAFRERTTGAGAPARPGCPAGPLRPEDRHPGSEGTGRVAEDLLRVGEPGLGSDDVGPRRPQGRAPEDPGRYREGGAERPAARSGEAAPAEGADHADPRTPWYDPW